MTITHPAVAPAPEANVRPAGDIDTQVINTIRTLAIDAVEKADSGHAGAPMGLAPVAYTLWRRFLRYDPDHPDWPNRDRFVLSNGHASMLLYALLFLTGVKRPDGAPAVSLDDIKQFRELGSVTPGHPEYGHTVGVETTTGPLGQGLANAVGMALAEKLLAIEFNRPGHEIVDHRTWVYVGDGCLMEGISHEACSLAGTLGLSKLIVVYDDNGISIDGHVEHWFADDTPRRFEAYGWRVIRGVDGHDEAAIEAAFKEASSAGERPTLVCCKTIIGKGSPHKAGTHDVHGAALGAAEVAATREALGWTSPPFEVPAEIRAAWDATAAGAQAQSEWQRRYSAYASAFPELAAEFDRRVVRAALPARWADATQAVLAQVTGKAETIASRKASQNAINALQPLLPELLGGSADLTGSNLTDGKASVPVRRGKGGNYINYGVREFGMSAAMNGVALHGGYIPYGGTFLTFSDYSRNAVRMSALMQLRVIYVFSHDSIGLGEDGPTHQPIEHVSTLRMIPNNALWRPCDSVETMVSWLAAIERRDGPTCLILSRQNLPYCQRSAEQIRDIRKGGYVLAEAAVGSSGAAITLLATGSEVALAMQARTELEAGGVPTRVVSMPSCGDFDRQSAEYRAAVLPRHIPVLAIEAGVSNFWRAYTGFSGDVVGIDRFGESAPASQVYEALGVTTQAVVARARALLARGANVL